jgi:hypothetical protein
VITPLPWPLNFVIAIALVAVGALLHAAWTSLRAEPRFPRATLDRSARRRIARNDPRLVNLPPNRWRSS